MKRTILLFAVVLSSAANIFSQTRSEEHDGYVSAFEADSTVWSYHLNWGHGSLRLFKTIMYGDTVIDNIKWKIITDEFLFIENKLLVRTDGKKVIVKSHPEFPFYGDRLNKEVTIYDFSLNVGDSVLIWYYSNSPGSFIKDEILETDSIVLNDGKKHKRMKFNWSPNSYMIEGIGYVNGHLSHPLFMFVNPPVGGPIYGPIFVCCEVDGELLYLNPDYLDCDGNKVANEIIGNNNPKSTVMFADENLYVTFNDDALFDVAVYNMQGIMLSQIKNNRKTMQTNLDTLPKGIYIVKVNSVNYVYSEKIIK